MSEYLQAGLSVFLLFAVPGLICAALVGLGDWIERRYYRRRYVRRR